MNKIINGNSLEILDTMESESVQMVYLDPPFNSGRKYKMNPNDSRGFSDIWESDKVYAEFIDELVVKSKRLLKKDGSLFFHISAAEMLIPQMVCSKNFRNVQPIFWRKSRSKNNIKKKLGAAIDVIFWCYDNPNKKFNMVYQPLDEKYLKGSYNNKDFRGNYALGHLVADPTRKGTYSYAVEIDGRVFNPERGWRISEDKLHDLIKESRVHVPKGKKGNLYKKIYLHESKGKPCMDLWDDVHSIAQGSQKRLYPTAKPIKLLERIVEMSTDEGDVVLDPVAGSGTTGIAARNLNRNFILIDENADAVDVMKNRLGKTGV